MAVHTLIRKQTVNTPRARAWAFFSDPLNLARITPPKMDFRVITPDLPTHIYPGMMIGYRVRPLLGLPLTWLTEITQVREGEFFVDEQRLGPYKIWHHEHSFRDSRDGGTEIEDRVSYTLSFGALGDLVNALFVRRTLEQIFDYREQAVRLLFPG